ncbi:hypothetical protein GV054_12385 [Marinomonas mediterranea]|uniref:Entry exclusion lipoprotein TrbK n=1 Tax=Marinomonas balearica TaxID=491947 RepID=A0A4R6M469_9GAMM|nr:hypothetical protein DFP79_3531 [Marinomonas balearica]WCN13741.1 hypothetical protein GV054_12385 [Marinomonas mediterranea]
MKLVVASLMLCLCTACSNLNVDKNWKSNFVKDVARNSAVQQCNEYPSMSRQYEDCVEETKEFYNKHQGN